MRTTSSYAPLLLAAAASAFTIPGFSSPSLRKRDDFQTCTDLSISSNNGDRKVAIVIDSSGSMAYNDPYDYRIAAGRNLNNFLISNSEAGNGKTADLVTVIDFDDQVYVDYLLGDPGNATSSFDRIDSYGGTYIALGVETAIQQLNSGGGTTDKRSAIVVFTDGEDYSTDELVGAINNATSMGIRVSFGFLDYSIASQPTEILTAIQASRGVYATVTEAAGSQNFINYVILNGLTYNDNPQGYDSQLLAGLAQTHLISNSDTVTLKYAAGAGENVNFTVTSISAGDLSIKATMGGKTLDSSDTSSSYYSSTYAYLAVTAPNSGELDLEITASGAPKDSMFSVSTGSSQPIKNCTVGVTGDSNGSSGLSTGAKAGIGVGVTAAVLGLVGAGGYFLWKHFHPPGGNTTTGPVGGNTTSGPTGGQQGMYHTGGEKVMPHTDVTPMNSTGGPPTGAPPPTGGGYASPISVAPGGPVGPPMGAPPTGGFAPAASGVAAPFAFAIPPVAPGMSQGNQNQSAPKDPNAKDGLQSPDSVSYYTPTPDGSQHPMLPSDHTGAPSPSSFNQPMSPDGYHNMSPGPGQHNMGPGAGQHTMGPPGTAQHTMYGAPPSQGPLTPGGGQHAMYPPGSQPPVGGEGYQYGNSTPGQHPLGSGAGGQQPMSPASTGTGTTSPYPHSLPPFQADPNMPMHAPPQDANSVMPTGGNHTGWAGGDPTGGPAVQHNPGFTMPGVPFRQHTKEKKHHHHEWLAPDSACEHPQCPLVQPDHVCSPDTNTCHCTCRDDSCPVTRRAMGINAM